MVSYFKARVAVLAMMSAVMALIIVPMTQAHATGVNGSAGVGAFLKAFRNNASVHANVKAYSNNGNDDDNGNKHGILKRRDDDKKRVAPTVLSGSVLSCIRTAVIKREAATASSYATFNTSVSAAISARGTALAAAWNIAVTADRNAAIKTAWKNYHTSVKTAAQKHRTDTRTAWQTFRTERRACGVTWSDADLNAEGSASIKLGL